MSSRSGLSIFIAALLILSVLFAYGITVTPVYASTGAPKLGAVDINPLVDNYNASSVVVAGSYVSIKAGATNVTDVDGTSYNYYFAIIFKINSTQLVTFSGSQFDLYISKDGYSSISGDDLMYADGFLVSDLQGTGLTNVNKTNSLLKGGKGSFWIGTINDTSTGTLYEVLIGPVPYTISADYKYIKIFDGSSSSVAVSIQIIKLLAAITLTPTEGPGGMEVTLEGYALDADTLINITENANVIAQVYTDGIGHFTYTWNVVDLANEWFGGGVIPTDAVTISVVYNDTGVTVDTVVYTEYRRAFLQVISLKYGDTTWDYLGSDYLGYGNNTIVVDVYVFDDLVVAGNFFNPTDDVVIKLGGSVLATVTPNATGFFNTTVTIPELTLGLHEIKVWNGGVYYNFSVYVWPTLILEPEEGPVGTVVTAKAYGFPAGNASIYWYEMAVGDQTFYNLVNATVGSDGKFVGTVTFVVPHSYGGIPHNVSVTSTWQGETVDNSTWPGLTNVIASAFFTVTPHIEIIPSEFPNNGSLVKVVCTGLNPDAAYVPNIDNNLLGVDVDYSTYPTDIYSPLVNDTGDVILYFVAAGFTPGLHVFSLYENESLTPLYATFTVLGPSPDTQTILNEIDSSKSDILTAITDATNNILSTLSTLDSKLDTLSSKLDDVVAAVNDAVDTLNNLVSQLPDIVSSAVADGLSDLSDRIDQGFADVMSSLSDISSTLDSLQSGLSDLADAVDEGFSGISDSLGSLSTSLSDISSTLDSLQSGLSGVQSGLSDLSDAMAKSASDTASFLLATIVLVIITLIFAAAAAIKVFRG